MIFASEREPCPIIVLGAARSGTKALRAAIATHPDITAIPHDINFIWKHGNYRVDHDALTADHARPGVIRFIRRFFCRRRGRRRIVEKTVSNTLRVPFVRRVFPSCTFVHLLRDGRDVAESAARMWRMPLDWRRILEKVPDLPLGALPSYGLSYAVSYARRRLAADARVSSWGPRWIGIDAVARERPLIEVCGIQWQQSVETALADLEAIPPEDVIEVRYESLIEDPVENLRKLFTRLGLREPEASATGAATSVQGGNVGKGRARLSPAEIEALITQIGPTLERLQYDVG